MLPPSPLPPPPSSPSSPQPSPLPLSPLLPAVTPPPPANTPPQLDLWSLPPVFVLRARLAPEQLPIITNQLRQCGCQVVDKATDATIFLGDINASKRALIELRSNGVAVVADNHDEHINSAELRQVRVVKLAWFTKSLERREKLKIEDYTLVSVMAAMRVEKPASPQFLQDMATSQKRKLILERAKADAEEAPLPKRPRDGRHTRSRIEERKGIDSLMAVSRSAPPLLLRGSTSEYEEAKENTARLPDWVRNKNKYSCCRDTPAHSPNSSFISFLRVIRHSRILSSDEIGVRAYSTAMASLCAYPFPIHNSSEVSALPGCDGKICALFQEWVSSHPDSEERTITAVTELRASEAFRTLSLFTEIWGVGPDTARKFYYDQNFRSVADLVGHYWNQLSRVQQIGVKFFDEFREPIPRSEVEQIGRIIAHRARRILPGAEAMIVGGYRRGKSDSHDVDVLITHRDDDAIPNEFIIDLLRELEDRNLIAHTLTLMHNSQASGGLPHHTHSFDALDKALVVWKTGGKDGGGTHRRVDIIVAPAISSGTALIGWSGGNTFQRDLRLWCEKERGWKFTSEGVWDRSNENVRIKGTYGWEEGESWLDVEKRVLNLIGVGWRPPEWRCTG